MMIRIHSMGWRAAVAAFVALLFVVGCGDSSTVVNGQDDRVDNPFLENATKEEVLPDGPHIRPDIDHAILMEEDAEYARLSEDGKSVILTGPAAEKVSHLEPKDIIGVFDKAFQVDTVARNDVQTTIGLRAIRFEEILYGKWEYKFGPGQEGLPSDTASQELQNGEAVARGNLSFRQLGCDKTFAQIRQELKDNFLDALKEELTDEVVASANVEVAFDVTADPLFTFRGVLPYHVGYSDNMSAAERDQYQRSQEFCNTHRNDSWGDDYCVQEFQAMLDMGIDTGITVSADLPGDGEFAWEPDPVAVCDFSPGGIPLGGAFELSPKFTLSVGASVVANYPAAWGPGDASLSVNPGYSLEIPIGYHYLNDTVADNPQSNWAPAGFEVVGDGQSGDPYKVKIVPNEDKVVEMTGMEEGTEEPENTSVEARVFLDLSANLSLSPTVTDRVSLDGPGLGVKGGLFGRWRPNEAGAPVENACLDTGAFVEPYLTASLTAVVDVVWDFKINILPDWTWSPGTLRDIWWWDEEGRFCFGDVEQPSPLTIELQWQDENADLDLTVIEPAEITYSNGVDSSTGMEHLGDTCPSTFAQCQETPNGDGNYTEVIEVVNESQAPDSGTGFTIGVEHFKGDSPASFSVVIKQNGSEVQTLSGSVSPDQTERLSFTSP